MNEGFLEARILWACPKCKHHQEQQIALEPQELARHIAHGLNLHLMCANCGHSGSVHIKVLPLESLPDELKSALQPQRSRTAVVEQGKALDNLAIRRHSARHPSPN